MSVEYPLIFTLEDGVQVEVTQTGDETFDFTLTGEEGNSRHFTFVDDDRTIDEKTSLLNFDQLNAVRAFWLKKDDVV